MIAIWSRKLDLEQRFLSGNSSAHPAVLEWQAIG
jgi:hypothetical protein